MLETTSINSKDFFKEALFSLNIENTKKKIIQKIARFIVNELKTPCIPLKNI